MKTVKQPGRIRAAFREWLGIPVDLRNDAFWSQFGTQSAGQIVNERTVMQLSAVWACTRLIAETISTLPLNVYERTPTGRRAAQNHPLQSIIHSRPNIDTTSSVFWESMIIAMLLPGNGVAEKRFIGNRLVSLDFLTWNRLTVSKDSAGNLRWRYTEKNGRQREIAASSIFRIPGFTLDGNWGVSAIQYGASVFGSALAASTAANSTFERGLMSTIAYKIDRILKKEQRDDFRAAVKSISGALNAGESPVLEGGMEAQVLSVNPRDAQLLESRNFSVEDICRWFRVPPWMVGHAGNASNWGTGIEQQMIGFLTFTLRPWLTRIEQAINKDLLSPADQLRFYAEFNIEGLLRADSAGRASYLSTLVNNGLMTRDEGRGKENLPPMGGNANVLTVQSAMIPIDQLGQTNTSTTTGQ